MPQITLSAEDRASIEQRIETAGAKLGQARNEWEELTHNHGEDWDYTTGTKIIDRLIEARLDLWQAEENSRLHGEEPEPKSMWRERQLARERALQKQQKHQQETLAISGVVNDP